MEECTDSACIPYGYLARCKPNVISRMLMPITMEVAVVAVEVTVVNVQEVEVIIESIPVLKINIK